MICRLRGECYEMIVYHSSSTLSCSKHWLRAPSVTGDEVPVTGVMDLLVYLGTYERALYCTHSHTHAHTYTHTHTHTH